MDRYKAFRIGKPPKIANTFTSNGGKKKTPMRPIEAHLVPGGASSVEARLLLGQDKTPDGPVTNEGHPKMGYPNQGCGSGALPGCKVRGYTNFLPEVPAQCAKYADKLNAELCVSHAGVEILNASNAAPIPFEIDPQNATAYWAQLLVICVFETGTQTAVNNGSVIDVIIRGASQFAGSNVALCTWNVAMPFLGVAWDMADSSNLIKGSLQVRSTGNVDVTIGTVGYGIR